MLHTAASQLGLAALIAVAGFVFVRGGPAERRGASLVVAVWAALIVSQPITGKPMQPLWALVLDLIAASGFLVLAIRYGSIWLGLAMMFQAATFLLHLLHLTGDLTVTRTYFLSVNLMSYGVLASLAGGALASWRQANARGRADQASASATRP